MTTIELRLLGGFALRSPAGEPVPLATKKPRALLAYLAMAPGRFHARDKLAGLLWGESGDVQARTSLRQALATVRRALLDAPVEPLVAEGDAVALAPDALDVDVVSFERLCAGDAPEALEKAVDQYRGELLEGLHVAAPAFDDWLASERQRFRELALDAMRRLLDHDLEAGESERGVRTALRLLALDPLEERTHRALMRLYARQGRPEAALRQFQTCKATLERELGVAPEAATDQLYKEIREQRSRRSRATADETAAASRSSAGGVPPTGATDESASPSRELRQVAVLFADLSGFTRLSAELDPEDLDTLLTRYFATIDGIIESHGGRVDKHIGDCSMAVFGAPVARGNESERAVRAALAIRDAMPALGDELGREIEAHVGVASGRVVIAGAGADGSGRFDVTGESVNLASRLTEMAGPGEVLLSDAVRLAARDTVATEFAGDFDVRGFAEPVKVWRAGGSSRPGEAQVARPFVGRRAELQQFTGLARAARDGGTGFTLCVRGDAGIGKTRLVEEFRRVAAAEGLAGHTGLVLDFGVGRGQSAISTLVRSLLGVDPDSDPETVRAAAHEAVTRGLIEPANRIFLDDLLDLPPAAELRALYEGLDPAARVTGRDETITELVRGVSATQPLLLVVEDVHWADAGTLQHLAALAAAIGECAALLVLTTRAEGDPLDRAWRGSAQGGPMITVDLGPLREREAIELAGLFLDPEDEVARRCIERAGGNPLFLEQLLRGAAEASREDVPGSVQSLVLARMDALAPADRRTLRAASVLGQRFSLDALRELLGDPDASCDGLVREALVRPEGRDYLFAHALVLDAVYGSLLKSERQALHRRAATWFAGRDPTLRAEHLDRAGEPGAADAYLAAAREETSAYRNEEAARLVERGLEIAENRATRYVLTCLHGDLLRDLGAVERSLEAFERALELADRDVSKGRAWLGIAAGMRIVDRQYEALEALRNAEIALSAEGEPGDRAQLHYLRGNIYFPLGDLEGCLREHGAALEAAREAGSARLEALALSGLGDAEYARGRIRTAQKYFERCVALCREHDFRRIEVNNLSMVAIGHYCLNRPQAAVRDALAAAEAAHRIGDLRAEMLAQQVACSALADMGETARVKQQVEQSLALARRLGARRFEPECLAILARVLDAEGSRDEALALLDQALVIVRETGTRYIGPFVLATRALITDDPSERQRALAEGEDILAAGAVSHNYLWFYRDAMEVALMDGDWAEVERYADALAAYTRAEPLSWSDFHVARGRALAAHGRGERGEATRRRLERLRDEAEAAGLEAPLRAIRAALATHG